MSGQLRTHVAPGRHDGLGGPQPAQRRDDEKPHAEVPAGGVYLVVAMVVGNGLLRLRA